MEESQLRLGDDGELIEIVPNSQGKGKRKKRSFSSTLLSTRISRLALFGFAVAFMMLFGFFIVQGLIDLNPNQFLWYRQHCLNALGKDRLAFTVYTGTSGDIYLTDSSGSRSCPLTYKKRTSRAEWMPNGEQLIFEVYDENNQSVIHAINGDGTHDQELAAERLTLPSLTKPSGKDVLFLDYEGLYSVSAKDSSVTHLYPDYKILNAFPSPDGRFIAISSQDEGKVFVVDADGSNRKELLSAIPFDGNLSWSPDGKLIAFLLYSKEEMSKTGLYVVNLDDSSLRQLASLPQLGAESSVPLSSILWSPDGKKIAYIRSRSTVGVVTLGNATQNYEMDLNAVETAWSPDSSKLLYVSGFSYSQIYILDPNNYHTQRLTQQGWRNYSPFWSSDGQSIAYVSNTNGVYDIYLMNDDGNNVHQITTDGTYKQLIGWQPQPSCSVDHCN